MGKPPGNPVRLYTLSIFTQDLEGNSETTSCGVARHAPDLEPRGQGALTASDSVIVGLESHELIVVDGAW